MSTALMRRGESIGAATLAVSAQPVRTVRDLNDTFRRTLLGGRVMVTTGVAGLPTATRAEALAAVRAFARFGPDNDPHDEHDFGAVAVGGRRLFWKIDSYDPELAGHSVNAADPTVTVRVLTIMLAEEY